MTILGVPFSQLLPVFAGLLSRTTGEAFGAFYMLYAVALIVLSPIITWIGAGLGSFLFRRRHVEKALAQPAT
jgi:hypothetical protein